MKRKMSAIVSIALTLALVLSLATTALAGSDNGKGGKSSGPQFSASEDGSADKLKNKGMSGLNANTKHEGNPSITNGTPEEAIAALSAEDKKILEVQIDAYEDAVEKAIAAMEVAQKGDDLSEYRKSVMTALKTLLKAAKDAGIELKTSMSSAASINGQLHRNWYGKYLTVTIEEALAALNDENKEILSDVIEAYEDAVAALEEAKEDAEDGDDLSAYREAVSDALRDLLDAAEEAGIDLGLKEFISTKPVGKVGGYFTKAVEEAIAALDSEDWDTLSDEIDDFEDALAAAEEAAEDADEDDDLSSYREAVMKAIRDLLDAAIDADIDLGLIKNCGR